MARPQRRSGDGTDPIVKLFVVSSAWPYKPTHSPSKPLVLLHGATEPAEFTGPESACYQNVKLAQGLLRPEHDLLFVIDVSEVASPKDWEAELGRPGRSRRMLERWFAKFNPKNATVIASGNDAELWLPLVRLHDEQRVSKMIVLGDPPSDKSTAQLAAGNVELCVLSRDTPMQQLVEAVDSQCSPSALDFSDLYFTYVDFDIDRRSKQLVQHGQNITSLIAESFFNSSPAANPQDVSQQAAAEVSKSSSAEARPIPADVVALLNSSSEPNLSTGISSTQFLVPGTSFTNLAVSVRTCTQDMDAKVLRASLADTHGCVEGFFLPSAAAMLVPGKVVAVSGRTLSLEGRLLVLGMQVSAHHGLREGYKPMSDGRRNVSDVSRRYGCLILRGRKCVLARDASGQLYIPTDEPRSHETAHQAATRSVAEACDIYPEEFATLSDVPPAVFYEKTDTLPVVVTIFVAIATNPPPPGSAEDQDTVEDEEDMYDWFPYQQAMQRLTSEKERDSITRLATDVAAAVDAGIVAPDFPCTFGACLAREKVAQIMPPPLPGADANLDMPQQTFARSRVTAKVGYGKRYGACTVGCC